MGSPYDSLPRNLRSARRGMRLTQSALARAVTARGERVTQSEVSKMELGIIAPRLPLLVCLARVLHTTPDALLGFRP